MNFDQYWKYRKEKIKRKYTTYELLRLEEEAKLSWNEALTNTVSMTFDTIHANGEDRCPECEARRKQESDKNYCKIMGIS